MTEDAGRQLTDMEGERRLSGVAAVYQQFDERLALKRYEKLRRWEFKLQAKL